MKSSKVTWNYNNDNLTPFCDVEIGSLFIWDDELMVKTRILSFSDKEDRANAIIIGTGCERRIDDDFNVEVVDVEIMTEGE